VGIPASGIQTNNNVDTLLAAFEQKVVNPALEKAQEVRLQKAAAPIRRSAED